jgi:hypothetical protein
VAGERGRQRKQGRAGEENSGGIVSSVM